jgi:anti-sigma-K factor RskA
MNIREYIQSGIIEQYVLGLANPEEAAELEQLRKEYPLLHEAVLDFEKSFEDYFIAEKTAAPKHIKILLETQLFGTNASATVNENNNNQNHSVPINNIGLWKYLAAASIILLIGSTALNFYFYSGYKNSQQQYQALLNEKNTLQANNASYQKALQMFQDTAMMRVDMKGTPGKEQNTATVLWDQKTRNVYLYAGNLQQAPSGKQYQLWAIVNGKPVNAGMVGNCEGGLCKMEKIEHAEAFAITLEKEGGSPVPTLTEMYVLGKV